MKALLKYPGAKWRIAKWIIGFFPEHHSYLEPYFGSGGVLFTKPRSNIETINDLDGNVVNLFECIREDPEKLARLIHWTPYSRQEYNQAYIPSPSDPFEKARDFLIRCNMGYGFRTNGVKVGWKNDVQGREGAYAVKYWNDVPQRIIETAIRLKEVQIEHRDAVDLIRRFQYPNVLIYADPPYMLDTRHGKQYRHEMDREDHIALLEALKAHPGPVLLSGYETELYNQYLTGWYKEQIETRSQLATKRTEVLWMNFEPPGQLRLGDLR